MESHTSPAQEARGGVTQLRDVDRQPAHVCAAVKSAAEPGIAETRRASGPLAIMGGPDRSGEHGLCRMHGERTGRSWMSVDPDLPPPSLVEVLWLLALILAFVVWVGAVQLMTS